MSASEPTAAGSSLSDLFKKWWHSITALDERRRFYLLLTIFNTMLVFILLQGLHRQVLRTEIRTLTREIRVIETRLQVVVVTADEMAQQLTKVSGYTDTSAPSPIAKQTLRPVPTPASTEPVMSPTVSTVTSVPTSQWTATPTPKYTATPTMVAMPTDTPTLLPTETREDVPERPPRVVAVTPDNGGNQSIVDITLNGANFRSRATVLFHRAGSLDISADNVKVVNAGQIECQVNLVGAVTGQWDVIVTNPSGKSGTLRQVFVVTPELHHFAFTPIENQRVNVPFTVTIAARDCHGNLVGDFVGAVALTDSTGTVSPADTGNFTSGTWKGNLTIAVAQANVQISASSGGRSGVSNEFHVACPEPSITQISPGSGVNTGAIPVTITGSAFCSTPSAQLGVRALQAVTFIDDMTLNAIVPVGIAAGTHDLFVTNPGPLTPTGVLTDAFTVRNASIPSSTLETSFLATYGSDSEVREYGDNDSVQIIFLEVPATPTQTLYVRIYDPDVGGDVDEGRPPIDVVWDTATTFTLYGGDEAYTHGNARRATFDTTTDPGIVSGTSLFSQTFTHGDSTWNRRWFTLPSVTSDEGEYVNGRRVFKLAVVGGSGDDGNRYNVALSVSDTENIAPDGARIFAYSWTFLLPVTDSLQLYPFVASSTSSLTQHNYDFDSKAAMTITRGNGEVYVVPTSGISQNGTDAMSSISVPVNEPGVTTWAVGCLDLHSSSDGKPHNDGVFWATDQNGVFLSVFTRSTNKPAPLP